MKALSFEQLRTKCESYEGLPASKMLSTLSRDKSCMDHFYLTGYEGLCLCMDHQALTRAVISSVVPMDREMLIVGDSASCALWRSVCASLSISVSCLDTDKDDLLAAMETVLKVNGRISHIMCSTQCDATLMAQFAQLARRFHASIVVDNSDDVLTFEDMESAGVDFVLAADAKNPVGVIIARRSRLVMAEGNARAAEHDIYAIWQQSLAQRNFTWAPMA